MYRTMTLALILATSLSAASIDFVEAPKAQTRVMPNTQNSILSFHDAIKNTTDSIVHIATKQEQKGIKESLPPQMHPFFEEFFGPRFHQKQPPQRNSLGSGVIVSKDGYIITNNHVIDKAEEIIVTIPGSEKEYEAKLIGTDPKSDVAVIKIDAESLHPIAMGTSSDLHVGDVVFAIGNPFGVGQTVTQGIISAQHKNSIGINEYENFIQTDASINPGNSGGALVDSRGVLIGINTAIITRSGGNNGIGFAIEVDMVKNIAKKLIEEGSIERGYLGVNMSNLTKELRDLYKNKKGALIVNVLPDTPAADAGLKRGDLIIKVDGNVIKNGSDLKNSVGMHLPGDKVTITYERDKKERTATVKPGNLEKETAQNGTEMLEGLEVMPLNDEARAKYRIPNNVTGVIVTDVKEGSEAARQEIRKGSVIVQIEGKEIKDMEDLKEALEEGKESYKRVYLYSFGRNFVAVLK